MVALVPVRKGGRLYHLFLFLTPFLPYFFTKWFGIPFANLVEREVSAINGIVPTIKSGMS